MSRVRLHAEALAPGRRALALQAVPEAVRFDLFTDTPLARERFSLLEIYGLLNWLEPGLTDHDIAERLDVPYHRVHGFCLKLRRAIHDFEAASIRLVDGAVEVDET